RGTKEVVFPQRFSLYNMLHRTFVVCLTRKRVDFDSAACPRSEGTRFCLGSDRLVPPRSKIKHHFCRPQVETYSACLLRNNKEFEKAIGIFKTFDQSIALALVFGAVIKRHSNRCIFLFE